jgi:hypothetical protein
MANSKLLKEAIADAKAVKETALANAKIALEEAFTPRLQSMLSQKMRAEAEAQDDDAEKVDEDVVTSSNIGSKTDAGYPETPGAQPNYKSASDDREAGVIKKGSGNAETTVSDFKKVADINEEESMDDEDDKQNEIAQLRARLAELEGNEDSEKEENPFAEAGDDSDNQYGNEDEGDDMGGNDQMHDEPDMDNMGGESDNDEDNEDDMDLEAIIRELEAQLGDDDKEAEEEDESMYEDSYSDGSLAGTEKSEDPKLVKVEIEDVTKASGKAPRGSFDKDSISEDVIDLEEILREMEADMKDDEEDKKDENVQAELNEAYDTIKSLQKTINEVNLLNAKLLFANKLFRAHNMTNEQKVKVIETLDRTNSVREVKLVYSTLAENFKFSTNKSTKKSISEGIASKVTKSTKPAVVKQVIAENTNFSDRFKKLAGIIK